jgi:WD40 repeat protein
MNVRASERFFISGGTLPPHARSYITRRADEELYQALRDGEFCYVLTPRQMGKSSLMVHTADRLRAEGVTVISLDLTAIGQNVTLEQWYFSMLMQIGKRLDCEEAFEEHWADSQMHSSLLQRWIGALQAIVLKDPSRPVVLFVDEVDLVLSLPFSTDEFFAGIRACYNRRSEDPAFGRLTFCLLGVADPADLIRDIGLTPFNIGRRIELNDFTREEIALFERGLQREEIIGQALLERIFFWTQGHPCLTQRLCQAVVEHPEVSLPPQIDALCDTLFLSSRAQEQDDNLTFVRDRLLKTEPTEPGLVHVLRLYERVCRGQRVPDNKSDLYAGILRLAGVTRSEKGYLAVRNRIYAQVFNRTWITAHLPDAELRRERAAHRRQLLRLGAVSSLVVLVIGLLARVALREARQAMQAQRRANQEHIRAEQEHQRAEQVLQQTQNLLYVMDMNSIQQAYKQGEYGRVAQLLDAERPRDLRGFEWRYYWQLMHADAHTFQHQGKDIISSIAFSPDGHILASANQDGSIKLWNVATRREQRPLYGHTDQVKSLAFCPTHPTLLASGSWDRSVRIWNITTGRRIALRKTKNRIDAVAFSADGRWLAAGDYEGTITLWSMDQKTSELHQIASNPAYHGGIDSVAFSPDGRWLAFIGTAVHFLTLPKLQAAAILSKPPSDDFGPSSMAFSPRDKTLFVGLSNGNIEHWDVRTRRKIGVLIGHKGYVNGLAFSPDGQYLASGSWDNTVRLWNMTTPKPNCVHTFIGHANKVTCVAFSPDGNWLASGAGQEIKLWNIPPRTYDENPCKLKTPSGDWPPNIMGGLALLKDGIPTHFILNGQKNTVTLWNSISPQRAVFHAEAPVSAAYSPDHNILAIGTREGKVYFYDAKSGHGQVPLTVDVRQNENNVAGLAFSPDGRMLATASGDPTLVKLWDWPSLHPIMKFEHTNSAAGIAFSPDGKTLAAANWQGRVYLFDLVTRKQTDWLAHVKAVRDVAFSPDGKTLATASEDETVKLWNVATQRELITLSGPTSDVKHIAFSPDGTVLAAIEANKTIWLYPASPLSQADAQLTQENGLK